MGGTICRTLTRTSLAALDIMGDSDMVKLWVIEISNELVGCGWGIQNADVWQYVRPDHCMLGNLLRSSIAGGLTS